MSRYLGPKVKLSRKVGVPIADTPKHTSKRQLNVPGVHGFRARRQKDYGIRKDEKQKLRYHYNVLERQFRRYLEEAGRRPGNTGEILLQLLEQRLDNVLRRAGICRTVWGARQLVVHGHVRVNGEKVDRPSFSCSIGDVVTIKDKLHKLCREQMESIPGHQTPGWIAVNPAELSVKVVARPTSDQVPFDVNTNLIVEFYR
ncbi:MAG: 30S ribosomal protein S4 [Planctomycetaceae bacterium]|jgi:small subunit ribosomal protein S4|nr:30S ribosomal protein S4 [Planctomycetaceae bacterium]